VEEPGWFEVEVELDEVQGAFVEVLRSRAAAWSLPADHAWLDLPQYAAGFSPGDRSHGKLIACADIPDPARNVALLTVGAHLDGDRVRSDEVHNQLLTLPEVSTALAFDATGEPRRLGELTADWLEGLLRRPIVRQEWLRAGEVYAHRWLFADSAQVLVEGKIGTSDLGPPDRIIQVRGDAL
jgi:hypothetical protein